MPRNISEDLLDGRTSKTLKDDRLPPSTAAKLARAKSFHDLEAVI